MWCMVIILLLWAPLVALGLELDEAHHLLARTSFGGTPAEIAALRPLTYEAAVDRLLNSVRQQPRTAPPTWVDKPPPTPLDVGPWARQRGRRFVHRSVHTAFTTGHFF